MQQNHHYSLPTDPPKRDVMLCVRLTQAEHTAIQGFAHKANISVSSMVRHFVLQAIRSHIKGAADDR
jgi:hypothetical protein